ADQEKGVAELADALDRHRAWLRESGELLERRRTRVADRVRDEVHRMLDRQVWQERGGEAILESSLDALVAGAETPYDVAARIVRAAGGNATDAPGQRSAGPVRRERAIEPQRVRSHGSDGSRRAGRYGTGRAE